MSSMLEQMMTLPLFSGVSRQRMSEVVGVTKLHFLKYPHGEIIFRQGDSCLNLAFVLSGSVRTESVNSNGRFAVNQTLAAPAVLAPDFLFGRRTVFPYTVTAIDAVSVVQVGKTDFIKLLQTDDIFLFNYLNLLSANAQKSIEGILALTDASLEERVAFWIIALTQPAGREISLDCRMRDLCALFNVQRNVFESVMQNMEDSGLITHTNSRINVLDRKGLARLLERQHE